MVIRHLAVPVWLPAARAAILPARLPVVTDITYQQAAIPAVNLAENALPIPAPAIHFLPARATVTVLHVNPDPLININLIPANPVTMYQEAVVVLIPAPAIHFLPARVTVNVLPANPDLLININLIPVIQVTSNPETPALKSKKNVRTDNIITAENAQIVTRFSQIVKKIVIISMIMILIFKAAIKNAIINTVPACQPQPLTVMITATESALL